jgi:hypothetical protein
MHDLVSFASLPPNAGDGQGFELAAPNPILGKAIFLRLPVNKGWKYEVNTDELHSQRNLILRDQMWVTHGGARFVAVHDSGLRLECILKIKRWNPRPAPSLKSEWTSSSPQEDERVPLNNTFEWLRTLIRHTLEQRLCIRCGQTERRIEIILRSSNVVLEREAVDSLMRMIQCH